jgi:hypothetical protein
MCPKLANYTKVHRIPSVDILFAPKLANHTKLHRITSGDILFTLKLANHQSWILGHMTLFDRAWFAGTMARTRRRNTIFPRSISRSPSLKKSLLIPSSRTFVEAVVSVGYKAFISIQQIAASCSSRTSKLTARIPFPVQRDDMTDSHTTYNTRPDNDDHTGFLASMTFASQVPIAGSCDCEECGSASMRESSVPPPIVVALQSFKRQRPLQRKQIRQLLKRQDDISVWEWALPLQAEPILEFGSSHRFIFVKRLPGILKTIGPVGIVGSQQEEESRQKLNWKQGDIILVPSGNDQAVGYVHSENRTISIEATDRSAMYATLIICKIPHCANEMVAVEGEENGVLPCWHVRLRSLCRDVLRGMTGVESSSYKLDDAQAKVFLECVKLFKQ